MPRWNIARGRRSLARGLAARRCARKVMRHCILCIALTARRSRSGSLCSAHTTRIFHQSIPIAMRKRGPRDHLPSLALRASCGTARNAAFAERKATFGSRGRTERRWPKHASAKGHRSARTRGMRPRRGVLAEKPSCVDQVSKMGPRMERGSAQTIPHPLWVSSAFHPWPSFEGGGGRE